jgi:hypothetical protein
MNMTLTGALVGTAVALALLAGEYFALRARAVARARQARLTYRTKNRTPHLSRTERERFAAIARFCAFVPPAFAGAFWLFWG